MPNPGWCQPFLDNVLAQGLVSTPFPLPLPGIKVWKLDVILILKHLPLFVALASSIAQTGDPGLPPDPDKCPEKFWAPDKAPHYGWKWKPPIGNQDGYWYNPVSPRMKLHPHLEWDVTKPPHWDYQDPFEGQWECDEFGRMYPKGVKWWE